MIELQPGTVMPDEYEWKEQFALKGISEPYVQMDAGKVRGLAIAYEESLVEITRLKEELGALKSAWKTVNEANDRCFVEIERLEDLACRAAQLIYGNPMTSMDKGETYSDAVGWLKEYRDNK